MHSVACSAASACSLHTFLKCRLYLNYIHEAQLDERFVQEITSKVTILVKFFKQVHPILGAVFPQNAPPELNALVALKASFAEAPLPCKCILRVSSQELLHLSNRTVFRSSVAPKHSLGQPTLSLTVSMKYPAITLGSLCVKEASSQRIYVLNIYPSLIQTPQGFSLS